MASTLRTQNSYEDGSRTMHSMVTSNSPFIQAILLQTFRKQTQIRH